MPKPRKHQIALEATPYYHCTSRCVRRAFLCGIDHYTGKSYEHRRGWIEERIHSISQAFCIDICAYAVMSNHLHVVLHINEEKAKYLSTLEVCERWHRLFKGTPLTQRFCRNEPLTEAETEAVEVIALQWREQLYSISWLMRCLNEPIARQANKEDNCTGSFWESRFACQALLDEKALAACMAYVDLNPIRAAIAETPEMSDYTSIKQRIDCINTEKEQPKTLYPFVGNPQEPMPEGLPFSLKDYIQLVDWTGRQFRENKRGAINNTLPCILQRLNIEPTTWLTLTKQFENNVSLLVGHPESIREVAPYFGYKRMPPSKNSKALFT